MLRAGLLALVLGGCVHDAGALSSGSAPENTRSVGAADGPPQTVKELSPLVDHHQHLLSAAAAALENDPAEQPVAVPASVAALLEQRAALTANASQLAEIFAADAVLLGAGNSGWKKGAKAAAEHISTSFAPGYRLTPVSFKSRGKVAQLAGYYTRGEGASLRHPGYFSMTLTQTPSGKWLIAAETPVFPGPTALKPIDAQALVAMLDAAGIRRSVILSNAYYFDGLLPVEGDPHKLMRAENDWTAREVRRFPDRLVAFCSFNPLADYALAELERCSKELNMTGLKLHFGTSGVDVLNPLHVTKLRAVFETANRLRMSILAHLTASRDYGRKHSEAFLRQVVPAAPDVPVVIAHLWGGAGYSDEALAVYADAVVAGDPVARNLYFEVAQASLVEGRSDENLGKITARMRQIGMGRILYGSDGSYGNGLPPRQMWADFRVKVPLSSAEFQKIARNVLPSLGN
jgi:predicted TIM-barrel fold metal-dependent hydrolase